ncbi:hypothetical protein KEC55_19100 [Burkholderia cepacia]|uniref:hypothetical protein n=1 Tax=Burkholderia cepacia TaxID=292 RepID=UPI00249E0394|nr:hypothetical protein [Burkholderia cepacia]WGY71925.1 hypothetical protein KEC55_19100 [Burkholderia cepacia]
MTTQMQASNFSASEQPAPINAQAALAAIETLRHVDDMGPIDEGWQSDKLNAARKAVDAVLARSLPGTTRPLGDHPDNPIDAASTGAPQ